MDYEPRYRPISKGAIDQEILRGAVVSLSKLVYGFAPALIRVTAVLHIFLFYRLAKVTPVDHVRRGLEPLLLCLYVVLAYYRVMILYDR